MRCPVTAKAPTTIKFSASGNDLLDLDPANFEQAAEGFRNSTGPAMGPAVRQPGRIENTVLLAGDTVYSTIPHTRVTNAGQTTLSGEVTYRERIALPENGTLRILLVDLAAPDQPRVQAEGAIASPGQVPLSFNLTFDDTIFAACR